MNKFLMSILSVTSINLAVAAEKLATCKVSGEVEDSISIGRWNGVAGKGTHFSSLARLGELHYHFGQSMDRKTDFVSLSRGHSQSGGVAYEFHVTGKLPLTLEDIQNNFSIECSRN